MASVFGNEVDHFYNQVRRKHTPNWRLQTGGWLARRRQSCLPHPAPCAHFNRQPRPCPAPSITTALRHPLQLLEGVSGVDTISRFDIADFPTKFAAQVGPAACLSC